jgi:hypothetical protein
MKELSEQNIHITAEKYHKRVVERAESEHNKKVKEYSNLAKTKITSSLNFNVGASSKVVKSGSGMNNVVPDFDDSDHSVPTKSIWHSELDPTFV